MQNKQKFLWQGFLMTGVSLLLRFVGVSTQIIIAGKIGAEGVGISALISGVGAFAVTLALSGIQPGCIRLMAEHLGRKDIAGARKTLTCSILHALLFGSLSGLLLFFGADAIVRLWIRDSRALTSLRILAITLPFISLSSCLGGYFVAVRRVYKSACAQIVGEVLRVTFTLLLLERMVGQGLPAALVALALGNAISDVFCAGILSLLCLIDRRIHLTERSPLRGHLFDFSIIKKLLSITLPIALTTYARSGLVTLEHSLIPRGLQQFGMDHSSALAAYGVIQSMALPVLLFPCALLWSFAGLLVPEVTESHVQKDTTRIRFMMQRVFSLTLFFAIGTSGIMIAFSDILGSVLYQNSEVSHIIRLLSPLIPVMYLDSATDAMLKGLGQQVYCMKVNIIDSLLSVILVLILIPRMGIYGYILTIYITELMNAALSIVRLLDIGNLKPPIISWVAKPLLCIIGATCVGRLLYTAFSGRWATSERVGNLTILLFVVIFLYALLLFFTGAIKKPDLVWLGSFFKKEKNSHVPQ